MTGNATTLTRQTATARAKENGEYVRRLLKVRQPQFAAALESACASSCETTERSACQQKDRQR